MTPILYDATETAFSTMGLGALGDALDIDVHTVLNGLFELEMKYPVTGKRYKDIKISNIIKVEAEKNGTSQLFDIYAISTPMNGIVTVNASHVSGRKQYIPIMPCTAANVIAAFDAIDDNAAENNPFTFWTNKDTVAPFRLKAPASLGQVLGGMEGSILDTYRGEYEFDNFMIKFWNHRGQDNGVTLRYGKNITSIEQEESIASTITGICPYWADMDGNSITLPEKTVDSAYAANFPFKRTVTVDFSADFDEAPTEAQLRARAQAYVSRSGIGVPSVGLDVAYENLADYEEYRDVALLEQVKLGDTVHVYFEPLDITAEARVTETYYKPLLGKYKKVRIGSAKMSLQQTINGVSEEVNQAVKSVSGITGKLEQAFQDALDLFSGVEGGNIIINRNPSTGKPYEILALDTDDVSTAQNVIRINNAGIAVSKNGILGPYAIAMTGAGIVANAITAGILNAIDINGSTITGSSFSAGRVITLHAADYTQADVTRLQQILLGQITPTEADYEHLDVNEDGKLDVFDVSYIVRMINTGNDITIDVRTIIDVDALTNEIIKVTNSKIGYNSIESNNIIANTGFTGGSLTIDADGYINMGVGSGSNYLSIQNGELSISNANHYLNFDSTNGLQYDFVPINAMTMLASKVGTGYTYSAVSGGLAQYKYFVLETCRGVGNGVMDSTVIPVEIARTCTSDGTCSWVYSAQNGTYSGQCYFNFSNNRVYLAASSNTDNQVRLYGVK